MAARALRTSRCSAISVIVKRSSALSARSYRSASGSIARNDSHVSSTSKAGTAAAAGNIFMVAQRSRENRDRSPSTCSGTLRSLRLAGRRASDRAGQNPSGGPPPARSTRSRRGNRAGRCYIPQARYPQDFGFRRGERMKDAVPLEQVAADIDALVTGDAAERLEQLIAGQLLGREGCGVAVEPTVEPPPRGQ